MAHINCPHCSFVAYGDSSEITRKMNEHIRREHEQSYRRSDSWLKCGRCNGTGKFCGLKCPNCDGSGVV